MFKLKDVQKAQLNKTDPQNFSSVSQEQFHVLSGLDAGKNKEKVQKTSNDGVYYFVLASVA